MGQEKNIEKNISGSIFTLIFILLIAALISACSLQPQSQSSQSTQEGRAVFTMTDDAANMSEVTSIKITVNSIKVLNESESWTTVSNEQQTYDLLKLKSSGTQVLLAEYNLTPGTYNQIRLNISQIVVTDASGDHTAKLPSGELKIVGKLVINANSTSTVKFDFIADESLHLTGNGTYIFAPVVKLETRQRANVDLRFRENVRISDGKIDDDRKEGMDIEGNFGEEYHINENSRLIIRGDKITEELNLREN